MKRSYNKTVSLNPKERVKRLKDLIKDAEEMNFNPKLKNKYKKQLAEQEDLLQKEVEKRKAKIKLYKEKNK